MVVQTKRSVDDASCHAKLSLTVVQTTRMNSGSDTGPAVKHDD